MSKNGAFVLPEGLRLTMEAGALAIHHEGDVVIEVNPGQALHSVTSSAGDITLTVPEPLELVSISAPEGNVTLGGRLTVESVTAKNIAFVTGRLKATVLKGSESVMLGGSRVEATVVVAPSVSIAGSVKGRATAISANNDLGPHQLKGGFSLAEFVDLVPNGADVLETHGIEVPDEDEEEEAFEDPAEVTAEADTGPADPVDEAAADGDEGEVAGEVEDDAEVEAEADVEDEDASEDDIEELPEAASQPVDVVSDDEVPDDGDTVETGEPPVAPEDDAEDVADAVADEAESEEDETAISALPEVTELEALDDIESVAEVAVPPTQDDSGVLAVSELPVAAAEMVDDDPSAIMVAVEDDEASIPPEWEAARATIAEALEEIRAAYSGEDVPTPIDTLSALVRDGALSDLKGNINGIWSGLLKHHQRTKAYIPNTVTHMFQQIQMELRKI